MASDGKVTISTALDNDGLIEDIENISSALTGLKSVAKQIGDAIKDTFSAKEISDFSNEVKEFRGAITNTTKEVLELQTNLQDVKKSANSAFESTNKYTDFAEIPSNVSNSVQKTSKAVGSLTQVFQKLGGAIVAAFSVKAILDFSKQAIELGSDLQEVQNVVDVTFGAMSGSIDDFAKNAITQFGLSELAAKQYTSTMGAMLKSMGFNTQSVVEMSKELTGLAGDMASFYNLDADDAFAKVRAGISGETEPLKQLGINLSVANLEAYALAEGIGKSYSAMSQQEQVMLRYNYLLNVTKDAQGDFARTSDGWANQTRILTEQFNSLKATIGQGLINALTPVISVINTILKGLQTVANSFRKLTAAIFGDASGGGSDNGLASGFDNAETSAESYGEAAKEAGEKAKKALAGFDEIQKLGEPAGGGSGGGGGAGGSAIGSTFNEIEVGGEVEDKLSPKMEAIAEKIKGIFAGVKEKITELIEPLKKIDFGPLKDSLKKLMDAFGKLGEAIGDALEWAWNNILVPLASWTIEEAAPALIEMLADEFELLCTVLEKLSPALELVWDYGLEPLAKWIGDEFVKACELLEGIFEDLIEGLTTGTWDIEDLLTKLYEWFAIITGTAFVIPIIRNWDKITKAIKDAWDGLKTWVKEKFLAPLKKGFAECTSAIKQDFKDAKDKIKEDWLAIKTWLKEKVIEPLKKLVSNLGDAISTAFNNAKTNVRVAWLAVKNWFKEKIITPLKDSFSKLCTAISTAFANAKTKVQTAWLAVKNWLKEKIITPIKTFFTNLGTAISSAFATAKTKVQTAWLAVKNWYKEKIITPIKTFFTNLGTAITTAYTNAKTKVQNAWLTVKNWFKEKIVTPIKTFFTNLGTAIPTAFSNAKTKVKTAWLAVKNWFKEKITDPIANTFTKIRTTISDAFTGARDAVKNAWNSISGWFKSHVVDPIAGMFSGIFSTVSGIFNGTVTFSDITEAIKNKFKEFINRLISGLNTILSKVVEPINTIIRKLKNFEIFGKKPFYWSLWEISTPSIPYLAKGAVIPPNAPFMAVLGDQRHGTNIEAPLSTIQEAVALVMEDMVQSNLAGHEATVAVLKQILEAVLGIELDGASISKAVNSYNRKMAVVKGGL